MGLMLLFKILNAEFLLVMEYYFIFGITPFFCLFTLLSHILISLMAVRCIIKDPL